MDRVYDLVPLNFERVKTIAVGINTHAKTKSDDAVGEGKSKTTKLKQEKRNWR